MKVRPFSACVALCVVAGVSALAPVGKRTSPQLAAAETRLNHAYKQFVETLEKRIAQFHFRAAGTVSTRTRKSQALLDRLNAHEKR